jgi:hypothetical protein
MIAPDPVAPTAAPGGRMSLVDVTAGRSVATRSAADLVVRQRALASDESVHQALARPMSVPGVH